MHHNSPGHRAAHPSPNKLPLGLGVSLVVAVTVVLLGLLPWWLALVLWLIVAVCLISVDRFTIAQSKFAWITDLSPDARDGRPEAAAADEAADDEDERRQA